MNLPLIVIVGRPNVGKSTLFNRLTKTDKSIVDDVSGVTRDRIYGEADWNGKTFRVIDTGGYVPESQDLFETAIREQVEIALEEADAILFVADGRIGVTPSDKEIANMLRRTEKPAYVLVNKSDNVEMSANASDYYSLGIENVFDISALNGRNLGDFLDDLIEKLQFAENYDSEDDRLKISFLGRPNVGKSSLTNSLLGFDRSIVTNIPGTTRDSINSVLKFYGEEIVLVDTAGLRRKTKVKENIEFYSNVRTYRAVAECDVAVLLLDAQFGIERQDLRILEEAVRRRKGIIIAVNKWDLIEKETNTARDFELEIKRKLGSLDYIPLMFISALTKQRIFKVIERAKEIAVERLKKIPVRSLNDTVLEEAKKNPPPAGPNGKEIKIKYITQVGDKYPIFLIFANDHNLIPEHYRRFIESRIRVNFGFEGVPMTVSFKES